jgi:hypothetical protein
MRVMSESTDPLDDFLQEEARETEANAKAAQELRWEIEDLAWLMKSKRGRRVMWRLLSNAGVYRQSFTGDALSTAFNEGQRKTGLRLLTLLLAHCGDAYGSMVQERTNV